MMYQRSGELLRMPDKIIYMIYTVYDLCFHCTIAILEIFAVFCLFLYFYCLLCLFIPVKLHYLSQEYVNTDYYYY